MKLRTFLAVLLLAVFTVFVAVNWSAINAPTTVSLVFDTVQAPLGLLLLGFAVLIAALFLLLLLVQQAGVIVETRRAAKELSAQRTLADQAEASRFTELRRHIDAELQRYDELAVARHETLVQQVTVVLNDLRTHLDQTGNTMAAQIGELDDRVERLVATRALPAPPA